VPEGDTIHRAARTLDRALTGQVIVAAAGTRHPEVGRLAGATVTAVEARGKHLLMRVSSGLTLHTHMKMNGSWHVYRPGQRWRAPAHLADAALTTAPWVAVAFHVPVIEVFPSREEPLHPVLRRLGPDLSAAVFDDVELARRVESPEAAGLTAAEALLDQSIACGLGNVYKSEILWRRQVPPRARWGSLPVAVRVQLFHDGRSMLRRNLQGVGRDTRLRGDRREAPLAVYGRNGFPCPRCGTKIEVAHDGDMPRLTYHCPSCQAES
jgi:endonuclease-8